MLYFFKSATNANARFGALIYFKTSFLFKIKDPCKRNHFPFKYLLRFWPVCGVDTNAYSAVGTQVTRHRY
jgi:hypothetical protein